MLQRGAEIDQYVVDGLIGRGGSALVYAVRHRRSGSRHALKVLRAAREGGRSLREVGIQAGLDHPNVVPIRGVIELGDRVGLLMPLVEGSSLDRFLAVHRLTLDEAAALFRGIVAGVAAVHHAGLVHRDIKPGNVLLDVHDGRVTPRLADFGLMVAAAEALGEPFVGTPLYAAPEQRAGLLRADARGDVWALGCVLYEMLAGERWPGAGDGPRRAVGLPEPFAGLLAEVFEADPQRRLPDAIALLERARSRPGLAGGSTRSVAARLVALPSGGIVRELEPTWDGGTQASWAGASSGGGLFGREAELGAAHAALRDGAAVVTLVGPPGIGKSRVLREVAGRWAAVGVDASGARSWADLVGGLSRALGIRIDDAEAPGAVEAVLASVSVPIALDGIDRLDATARARLASLAERGVGCWLLGARQALGAAPERVIPIGPLGEAAARALFEARCRTAGALFRPRPDEDGVVGELLALLDGIPLAIELAAARIRALSPRVLLERLRADRFGVLASPRGPSLEAALASALGALRAWEREALAQLAVFEGGFEIRTAERVVALGAFPEAPWVTDVVGTLVDLGLIRAIDGGRFGMLSVLRAYVRERSPSLGAEVRHGEALAARFDDEAVGAWVRDPGSGRALLLEIDDLDAAARRALERGDRVVAARAFCAVWTLRRCHGPLDVSLGLGQAVLALPLAPADRAAVARRVGIDLRRLGRLDEALEVLGEAVAAAEEASSPALEACLDAMSRLACDLGRPREAVAAAERAVALARARGVSFGGPLGALAAAVLRLGDYARAEALFAEAIAADVASGDLRSEAASRGNRAYVLLAMGRFGEAIEEDRQALALARRMGDRAHVSDRTRGLGSALVQLGRHAEAGAVFEESVALAREVGDPRRLASALGEYGDLAIDVGEHELAQRCLDEAVALAHHSGVRTSEAVSRSRRARLCLARGETEAALREAVGAIAVAERTGDVWDLGICGIQHGRALLAVGRIGEGVEALDGAVRVLRGCGAVAEMLYAAVARAAVRDEAGLALADEARRIAAGLALPAEAPLAIAVAALP